MLLVEFLLAYGTCKQFYHRYEVYFSIKKDLSKDEMDELLLHEDFPLRKPFEELCKTLGGEPVHELPTRGAPNKRRKLNPKYEPSVVLAFDEVHTLANGSPWSRFGEMRRAVRGLLAFSLFTLFLSTSGTLFGITPAPGRDFSSRMLLEGEVMMPFCELGFDQLAQILDFGKTVKLSQVTSDEHLISYGRPLCVLNVHCVRHLILPQIPSGIPIWTTGKYIPLCSPEAAGWHSI